MAAVTLVAVGAWSIQALIRARTVRTDSCIGCPFDAFQWWDQDQVDGGARLALADGLIARDELRGMKRDEVLWLLGPESEAGYFKTDSDTECSRNLVYWLGPERGWISIDSEWLVIDFGSDGVVSEYRILRD